MSLLKCYWFGHLINAVKQNKNLYCFNETPTTQNWGSWPMNNILGFLFLFLLFNNSKAYSHKSIKTTFIYVNIRVKKNDEKRSLCLIFANKILSEPIKATKCMWKCHDLCDRWWTLNITIGGIFSVLLGRKGMCHGVFLLFFFLIIMHCTCSFV